MSVNSASSCQVPPIPCIARIAAERGAVLSALRDHFRSSEPCRSGFQESAVRVGRGRRCHASKGNVARLEARSRNPRRRGFVAQPLEDWAPKREATRRLARHEFSDAQSETLSTVTYQYDGDGLKRTEITDSGTTTLIWERGDYVGEV